MQGFIFSLLTTVWVRFNMWRLFGWNKLNLIKMIWVLKTYVRLKFLITQKKTLTIFI